MTKKFGLVGMCVGLVAVFVLFAIGTSAAMAELDVCGISTDNTGLFMRMNAGTGACEEVLPASDGGFELILFLSGEWLVNGSAVVGTLLVTATFTLTLIDLKASLGVKAAVLCSGILDGTISAKGEGEFTEALTLGGTGVSLTALSGTALLCAGQEGCETSAEGAEVWAVKLPWKTVFELYEMESPVLVVGFIILGIFPSWYVQCKTALGTVDDECTTTQSASEATNATGGVTSKLSELLTLSAGELNATCTASSEKETGVVEGTGELTSSEGTLSGSSE